MRNVPSLSTTRSLDACCFSNRARAASSQHLPTPMLFAVGRLSPSSFHSPHSRLDRMPGLWHILPVGGPCAVTPRRTASVHLSRTSVFSVVAR